MIPPSRAMRTLPVSVIMWLVLSRPQGPKGLFSFLILTPLSSLTYIREYLTVSDKSLREKDWEVSEVLKAKREKRQRGV